MKPASEPGTILALTRILEVGSRDYAIKSPAAGGSKFKNSSLLSRISNNVSIEESNKRDVINGETLPDWIVKCGLTVLEHTKSPLERIVKKKRRKGYKKTIQHKQGWTRLRVGDIELGEGVKPGIEGEVGLA